MAFTTKENNILEVKRYRPEIDGIRSLAVITVIVNHFNKDILSSGYNGVDIFFVISGFVITSSLYERRSKNFIDFISAFYERRVKRIFPALIFFVLTLAIITCFFNPQPGINLKTGIFSLFGISNIFLWQQSTDYFAQSTQFNVFTHTWSLGVEEQFYILYPFLVWLTGFGRNAKKGIRNLSIVLGIFTIASFISFIFLYQTNQPAAYFLMPTRFWEMALGCLLFLGAVKKVWINNLFEKASPLVVLFIIVGIMFLPLSFALFSTISIVFLTCVLIVSLKSNTTAFNLLTHPHIINIGKISYSLYLWHWGIISISRLTIGISWWTVPLQLLLIFCLAIASYIYIETPLRKQKIIKARWKIFIINSGILVAISGILISLGKPFKGILFLGKNEPLGSPYAGKNIIRQNCLDHPNFDFALERCWIKVLKKGVDKKSIYFMGDSHNETMSQAAEYISNQLNTSIFVHSRRGTVFPFVTNYSSKSWNKNETIKNHNIQRDAEDYLIKNLERGDIVVISLRYPAYFSEDEFLKNENKHIYKNANNEIISRKEYFNLWQTKIYDFSKQLSKFNAKLIITTPTPEWEDFYIQNCKLPEWFYLSSKNCKQSKSLVQKEYKEILKFMNRIATQEKNVYLFDSLSALCSEKSCFYRDNKSVFYSDENHISNYGSRTYIGPKLLELIKIIQ